MWRKGIPSSPDARYRARGSRPYATSAERYLWQRLRRKQMCGVRFHRRKAVLDYIAHFYCPKAQLVIFIDQEPRRGRDGHLRAHGILPLYFTTAEVLDHTDQVQEAILETVKQRLPGELNCEGGSLRTIH